MTAHYWFLIVALGGLLIFGIGIYSWWKSLASHAENLHRKIRDWLDTFSLSHNVMPWPQWHFAYNVTVESQILNIGRPRSFETLDVIWLLNWNIGYI